ncbi:MAG: hypothetical protein IPL08_18135 [Saprospiraceae bacterium]|nr:hypothetical protein [Saprospiraceae bacterium]
MLVYWLPFTLIVYSFWDDNPEYKRLHALYFIRNLALCGGLFLLIANGAGKYSVKKIDLYHEITPLIKSLSKNILYLMF